MTYNSNTLNSVTGTCSNPQCNASYDINEAQEQVIQRGLALAYCDDVVFQVIECRYPGCRGKVVFRSDTASPALDMRGLLLVPNPITPCNSREQAQILRSCYNWHDYLKFQIVTAWDESAVSISEFIDDNYVAPSKLSFPPENEYIDDIDDFTYEPFTFTDSSIDFHEEFIPEPEIPDNSRRMLTEYIYASLFMSEENFYTSLDKEETNSTIILRRLLPNTLKNNNLLTCLAPSKIDEIFSPDYSSSNLYGCGTWNLTIKPKLWKSILEEAEGKSFEDAVVEKLVSIGIEPPNLLEIASSVGQQLLSKSSHSRDQLWDIVFEKGFDENLGEFFKKVFRSICYPICTEFALANQRKELLNWANEVEQGKALFVDAPMGLGKTHAIVEVLAPDPNLSAVIFMPTNMLCQEIIENLKARICLQYNDPTRKLWNPYDNREQVIDNNGNPVFEDDGSYLYRFTRTFLNKEVYYADGINPKECPYFDEFVKRYKCGLFTKIDVCGDCEKFLFEKTDKIACRFRSHHLLAPLSRIVVTTHQQYRNFSKQSSIRKWFKNGEKEKGIDRSFFIVDEDIVFSQCYEPTCLDKEGLKNFIATITDFMANPENLKGNPVPETAINNIDRILAQFEKCDKSSVVPAIDPEFKLPSQIKNVWEEVFNTQNVEVPEILASPEPIGNYLEIIEKAICKGFAVQNYEAKFNNSGKIETRQVKKAFLPNPNTYDLKELPPHVFFDGTMLNEKFLANKLKNVEFKKIKITIKPIWNINVRQNIWTDLPKYKISHDRKNVEQLISDLFRQFGNKAKYFIVTKKGIREEYLDEFLKSKFYNINYVINHYGNLRGENRAEDCDIGIMLGSYAPSDAVEITMALDFIQDKLTPNRIITSKNNLWTFSNTNFRRVYSDDFAIVGEMADAYRHSEHRQALARTRYLFHDVDFFIISKDLVSDYDPFLPEPIDCQYRTDLFDGRSQRPEAKEKLEEVVGKVFEWLKTHDTVTAAMIFEKYAIRRQTVGNKLKEMYANGLLELEKGKKTTYRLPATDGNGQDSL